MQRLSPSQSGALQSHSFTQQLPLMLETTYPEGQVIGKQTPALQYSQSPQSELEIHSVTGTQVSVPASHLYPGQHSQVSSGPQQTLAPLQSPSTKHSLHSPSLQRLLGHLGSHSPPTHFSQASH